MSKEANMQVARRLYIYLVTYISLLTLAIGTANLIRLILQAVSGFTYYELSDQKYYRDQFSLYGAITLVGALVWAVHWLLARRSIDPARSDAILETNSVLRKLLIYGVLLTAVWLTAEPLAQFASI